MGRIGTFLWSCATFGAAVTPRLSGLFGARFLLGVGEAPTFPANAKAIGLWFPPQERSFATSLFDAAAKFASAIGVPLIGIVLLKAGWRWSFALTGLSALSTSSLLARLSRSGRRCRPDRGRARLHRRRSTDSRSARRRTGPRSRTLRSASFLRQRKVIGLALGFGAYNYVFYLLLTWLPTYLSSALHIDLLHSFLYTSVPWIIATFTDLFFGGWLVDFLIQRGYDANRVRRIVLIGGMAFGLGIFGAAHAAQCRARARLDQRFHWRPVRGRARRLVQPSLIATRANVGKVGGIINFSGQVSGIAAPIITGYVVQTQHSYAWAFVVPAAYLLVGIAGYIFLLGRIEVAPQPRKPQSACSAWVQAASHLSWRRRVYSLSVLLPCLSPGHVLGRNTSGAVGQNSFVCNMGRAQSSDQGETVPRIHFHQQLAELKDKLLAMAALAQQSVESALDAYLRRDKGLCKFVKQNERAIDTAQRELDEMAYELLAKEQPMAIDLRFILAVIKINGDLERIGDQAMSIARRTKEILVPRIRRSCRWILPPWASMPAT